MSEGPEFPEASEVQRKLDADTEAMRSQPHLGVYEKYFVLAGQAGRVANIWVQGKQSKEAQARYKVLQETLNNGFFIRKIEEARSPEVSLITETKLSTKQRQVIEEILSSVTDQAGRALVDILILQLVIKTICPEQDIRLHKGSSNNNAFSWAEGISMRSLDGHYIVPLLRQYDLLHMNKDGAYMTRSFAENYPYTLFYKAEIRGAKRQGKQRWLEVVDDLENGRLDAEAALLYVLQLLWSYSDAFNALARKTLDTLGTWIQNSGPLSLARVTGLIKQHFEKSETKARLLEVAIHALLQAQDELMVDSGGRLKPLMPMRTGNKKHGNIGDVEVLAGDLVVEAWDAKYDQPYLGDAIDELAEKIRLLHISDLQFGYILYPVRKVYSEVERKIDEIEEEFGIKVHILTLDEWVHEQFLRSQIAGITERELAEGWLRAYTESLCLRRRDKAPIDEPTFIWIELLLGILT